jgi:hypothetical protein
MLRIPQRRNVHRLATNLASTLTVLHLTSARAMWDTAWPLMVVIQRVFLCAKVGAPMGNALLPVSVRATLVTPETPTTELETSASLRAPEVASTATALPPTSVPAIMGTLKVLKVTYAPHIVLQVA